MRLSYSLLEHFQTCEFRTKVLDVDRLDRPLSQLDLSWINGEVRHEGQRAVLFKERINQLEFMRGYATKRRLHRYFPQETVDDLIARADNAVRRWEAFFRPYRFAAAHYQDQPIVDARFVLPLNPPIGVFTEYVIKPDFVASSCDGTRGMSLWDWKWGGDLGNAEDLRYDLQSAIYQRGLAQLGIEVVRHGQCIGLLEEPTVPHINKDGSVSRRRIRCSWDDYVEAIHAANGRPEDYEDVRSTLLPFFAEHVNFRALTEVDAVWNDIVVPLALKVSEAYREGTFVRRMSKIVCSRCSIREDCFLGLRGQADKTEFNTMHPVRVEES